MMKSLKYTSTLICVGFAKIFMIVAMTLFCETNVMAFRDKEEDIDGMGLAQKIVSPWGVEIEERLKEVFKYWKTIENLHEKFRRYCTDVDGPCALSQLCVWNDGHCYRRADLTQLECLRNAADKVDGMRGTLEKSIEELLKNGVTGCPVGRRTAVYWASKLSHWCDVLKVNLKEHYINDSLGILSTDTAERYCRFIHEISRVF